MAIPNFPDLERRILQDWKDQDVFGQTLRKPAPKGRFVFFDGPPTANGMPHIGHVETRAFKDIIPRFKTMQGYLVERKAGWDTQGLPVEIEVEKSLGISGKNQIEAYGVEKFNAAARTSVWKYKELWEKMTERIGFWLDLDHPYITYNNDYIESLWWIFKQAWDQKLLEQDFKVVPYCPRCGTALSSHEVAQGYQKVKEPSVYIKFELVDEPKTFVLAWTTTPWTLPGNVALAVDKDFEYVKVQTVGGEFLILAKALMHKLKPEDQRVVSSMKGSELIGKPYQPLFDFIDLGQESGKKSYYIADADFVTTEDGTGVVHTAVMYGVEDFDLGKKLDLPTVHTVDLQGKFTDLVKPWAGREVKDAKGETQQAVIDWLREHGQLYQVEEYEHDYPFCWRCKHALLYYAKTTWFIRMTKLQKQLIANNQKINWYPKHIKDGRFGEWLREVKDWAISRERYWGTPLPIWSCDQCDHQECFGSYADLAKHVTTKNTYYFVRHGESTNNVSATLDTEMGDGSATLTPKGQKQAAAAAKELKSAKINCIYSSQFPRAVETATIIAKELGLSESEDVRLNEYHIGPVYENKPADQYRQEFPRKDYRFDHAPEGGETWVQVQQRMVRFIQQLEKEHDGQNILIVSHADTILVAGWAMSFSPRSAIDTMPYPQNGEVIPLHVPVAMFNAEGLFDPHRPYVDAVAFPCPSCKKGMMHRTPEVADTWFDSGSMPFAQWHYPFENKDRIDDNLSYPADFISEAIDQTRGWFYTLLAVATIVEKAGVVKEPPFKNVVVLGHVMDAKGKKLSKSAGNYVDPMAVIDQYGADAVRWFLYSTNQPWDEKNFDTKIVEEGIRKTFLILLNVLSFWELYGRKDSGATKTAEHVMDRWLVSTTNALVADMTERLEKYDVTGAARRISEYITDLSTWYVRRSRDRMKGEDGADVAAFLQSALRTLAQLMAPFTPFLSEELFHRVGGDGSVHVQDWPVAGAVDAKLAIDMATARAIVEQALMLRAKAGLKIRQPLQQIVVTTALRPELDEVVREELNVKELHAADSLPTGDDWVGNETVALDITISDELREEGQYRDLVREVNSLRKTAGLQPSDLVIFHCQPETTVAKLVERFGDQFLTDVRARAATPSMDGATTAGQITFDKPSPIGISNA